MTVAGLALAPGDVVVYRCHGVGRVVAIEVAESGESTVVLELEGTLRVRLPLVRAAEALRAVSDEAQLALVSAELRDVASRPEPSWSKRFRTNQEHLARGDAVGLAAVVREGIRRDRETAATGRAPSSPAERELYVRARRLLTNEISVALGLDLDAADAWIAGQVVSTTSAVEEGPAG